MTARRVRRDRTCLHELATGWITAADLCSGCTGRFMVALDRQAGERLPWHQNYRDRASGSGEEMS